LEELGIEPNEALTESRKLMFETNRPDVRLLVLRAIDVPPYVERGGAHLGIAGKDTLLEYGSDMLCEPVDLRISKCRLMTATQKGVELPATGRIRVATKYVNVARQYYASRGRQIDPIKLYGAMELAPIVGLADIIVDLVESGNTLKANGLVPLEYMCDISSRLVVNKASWKMKHNDCLGLVDTLSHALKQK